MPKINTQAYYKRQLITSHYKATFRQMVILHKRSAFTLGRSNGRQKTGFFDFNFAC